MTLYEVFWNDDYDLTNSLIFTTLEKAKEYYNSINNTRCYYSYGKELLTLFSFESDIEDQKRTEIESKVLQDPTFWTQDTEEDEWECNLDEFNTCDIEDTY